MSGSVREPAIIRGRLPLRSRVAGRLRAWPGGPRVVQLVRSFLGTGREDDQWQRVVMNEKTRLLVQALDPRRLDVLEISGDRWEGMFEFRSYRSVQYPAFDVCAGPLAEKFDLIIAEQVFEHLLWPYRAARHVYQMLRPGGHALITVPFLIKRHECPHDCSRWTETGLRYLLAEAGWDLHAIQSGSWGNRACVAANFRRWQIFQPWRHSRRNEREFPVQVWALACKTSRLAEPTRCKVSP